MSGRPFSLDLAQWPESWQRGGHRRTRLAPALTTSTKAAFLSTTKPAPTIAWARTASSRVK